MTKIELTATADAEHSLATALILEDKDSEAKLAYERSATLYEQAGDWQNAGYMRECAEACFVQA